MGLDLINLFGGDNRQVHPWSKDKQAMLGEYIPYAFADVVEPFCGLMIVHRKDQRVTFF